MSGLFFFLQKNQINSPYTPLPVEENFLLLESGGKILLQNGGYIKLES